MGLRNDAGTAVSSTYPVHFDHSQESEVGPRHHKETVPEDIGPHGSSFQRNTFWSTAHEGPAVVAEDQGILPEGKSVPPDT